MDTAGGGQELGDDERRWELEPPPSQGRRFEVAIGALVFLVVWLPIEVWLVARAVEVMNPFTAGTRSWGSWGFWEAAARQAIPLVTLLSLPLAAWTGGGLYIVRSALRGDSGHWVTIGPRGVRVERRTRRGRFSVVADLAWDEIRHVEALAGSVALIGRDRTEIPVHRPDQGDELAGALRERIAPGDQPPLIAGWTAYVDDFGPTVLRKRSLRRQAAYVIGGLGALGWVNTAVLATGLDDGIGWWPLTGIAGAVAVGLTYATYRYTRFTPRWTARPGVVVRIDQSGAAPAFEGRSLEVEISGEHGWLYADTTRDGHEGSRARVMVAGPQSVRDVSRWLADAAEIPVRHIAHPVAGGDGTALI